MRFALIYDFDLLEDMKLTVTCRLICIQLLFSLSEYKPLWIIVSALFTIIAAVFQETMTGFNRNLLKKPCGGFSNLENPSASGVY